MPTIRIPWLTIVNRADPGRGRALTKEPEYEFKNGRRFTGDSRKRGAAGYRAPQSVIPPIITGAAIVGNVLVCDPGQHIGSPDPTVTYQWFANGVAMPGFDEPKLLVIEADIGALLTCIRTLSNSKGAPVATETASVGPVAARPE